MPTIKVRILNDGAIVGVYNDQLHSMGLGRLSTKRLSNVEFDEAAQQWVASANDGREIARHNDRGECIAAEVKYFHDHFEEVITATQERT